MINFALIDDNEKVLNDTAYILENIFSHSEYEASIGFKTCNADEFINYVENNKVDVLFLDINLKSYVTGIQIADKIRKFNKSCYIIFITAHLEYSLIAYKYKVFDFIPKPVTSQRLKATISRLFDDIASVNKNFIKIDNNIISENELQFIEKDGMKLVFHTDSNCYEVYGSFSKIQDKLPKTFVRCHKSFIANVNSITKIETRENEIYFNNSSCEIGPKYKKEFMEAVYKYGTFD